MQTYRIEREQCMQVLMAIRGSQRVTTDTPEETYEALKKYGTDLVAQAREKKMDPVIGRDDEIRNVCLLYTSGYSGNSGATGGK